MSSPHTYYIATQFTQHWGNTLWCWRREKLSAEKCNIVLRTQLLLLSYTRSENSGSISSQLGGDKKKKAHWCQSICGKLSVQTSSTQRIRFNGFSPFPFWSLEFNKFHYINGKRQRNERKTFSPKKRGKNRERKSKNKWQTFQQGHNLRECWKRGTAWRMSVIWLFAANARQAGIENRMLYILYGWNMGRNLLPQLQVKWKLTTRRQQKISLWPHVTNTRRPWRHVFHYICIYAYVSMYLYVCLIHVALVVMLLLPLKANARAHTYICVCARYPSLYV